MNMVMVDDGPRLGSLAPFALLLIALVGYPIARRWRPAVFVLLPVAALCAWPLLIDGLQLLDVAAALPPGASVADRSEIEADVRRALVRMSAVYGALFLAAVVLPSLGALADHRPKEP